MSTSLEVGFSAGPNLCVPARVGLDVAGDGEHGHEQPSTLEREEHLEVPSSIGGVRRERCNQTRMSRAVVTRETGVRDGPVTGVGSGIVRHTADLATRLPFGPAPGRPRLEG